MSSPQISALDGIESPTCGAALVSVGTSNANSPAASPQRRQVPSEPGRGMQLILIVLHGEAKALTISALAARTGAYESVVGRQLLAARQAGLVSIAASSDGVTPLAHLTDAGIAEASRIIARCAV